MAVSYARFIDPTYQLTGSLTEVPNLGRVAVDRLAERGITSTWQLLGYFLDCGRRQEVFAQFLDSCDAPKRHTPEIAKAIAERVSRVGIKLAISLPSNVVQSSRITDDQLMAFLSRRFNQSLEHDFARMGMGSPGKPSASVANLHRAGITSTDQLFAAFLKQFDGPIHSGSADKAAQFYAQLKDRHVYGVAPGYSATIVDAIKAQLDIGIDTAAGPRAATIPEEPGSPPGTDQRPRVGRTAPEAVPMGIPVCDGAQSPDASAPAAPARRGAAAKAPGGCAFDLLSVLLVAAGVGAYYWLNGAHNYEPSYALVLSR